MDALAIAAVTVPVVALTQILKWGGVVTDKRGPVAVLVLSAIGVLFWVYSSIPAGAEIRPLLFGYFAGWVIVSTSAAGVYGFTRSGAEAITSTKSPPAGAGASPTNPAPEPQP